MENSFGNLGSVHPIFNEEKIQEKLGGVLFQNAKKINLEVRCHQFRIYGRDFRDLLELLGFTSKYIFKYTSIVHFAPLPSGRLCLQFIENPKIKKREYLYGRKKS